MCKGLGFDLCEIARMEKLLADDRFLNRFFSEEEIRYIRSKGKGASQSMAGIFAAKEALAKALGTGLSFELKEAEVRHTDAGQPYYALSGQVAELAGGDRFWLSITHEAGVAGAVCFREADEYPED